jgi:hypothetical protein
MDEDEFVELLQSVGDSLEPSQREILMGAHDEYWCAAHNEGQLCCIDYLLRDVE